VEQNRQGHSFFVRARVYISACAICFAAIPAFSAPDNAVVLATATIALQSASPKDRAEAARVLGREKAVEHITDLQNRLSVETDKTVRQAIVVSLANLGAPAFEGLKGALADPIAEVRLEAANGLGRIGTPAASAELRGALAKEANEGVKQNLIFWLGQLKDDAASDEIGKALTDGDANLRAQAAHSLGRIGSSKAKGHLRRAPRDPDAKVRQVVDENK